MAYSPLESVGKRKSQSAAAEPRTKKLRLTSNKNHEHTDEVSPASDRPRRRSVKSTTYAEDESTRDGDGPKRGKSSNEPISLDDSDDDDNEKSPEPYTAEFLTSYIEDDPQVAVSTTGAASDKAEELNTDKNADNDHDRINHKHKDKTVSSKEKAQETPAPVRKTRTKAKFRPEITSSATPDPPQHQRQHSEQPRTVPVSSGLDDLAANYDSNAPAILDDEATVINKLSHAVHALGNLNVPAPPRPLIPQHQLSGAGVDSLLTAAGKKGDEDSDSDEEVAPEDIKTKSHGTVDVDLRILIQNAVHLLRTSMVTKVHIQGVNGKTRGRPKRDLKAAIDADRFAMSSLEAVAKSSALNINCVITPQRANLLYHLYMSLLTLVTPNPPPPPPHHMMPPPPPAQHYMAPPHHMSSPPPQHGFPQSSPPQHPPGPHPARVLESNGPPKQPPVHAYPPRPDDPRRDDFRRDDPRREDVRREGLRREDYRRDDPRREDYGRDDPFRRGVPNREDYRRDDLRRDDHRMEPRREIYERDAYRRDEPRGQLPRKEDYRREDPREQEYRRLEARRGSLRREDPRGDDFRRPEPKREPLYREDHWSEMPRKDDRRPGDFASKEDHRLEEYRSRDEFHRGDPRREAYLEDKIRRDEYRREQVRREELRRDEPRRVLSGEAVKAAALAAHREQQANDPHGRPAPHQFLLRDEPRDQRLQPTSYSSPRHTGTVAYPPRELDQDRVRSSSPPRYSQATSREAGTYQRRESVGRVYSSSPPLPRSVQSSIPRPNTGSREAERIHSLSSSPPLPRVTYSGSRPGSQYESQQKYASEKDRIGLPPIRLGPIRERSLPRPDALPSIGMPGGPAGPPPSKYAAVK